MVTWRVLVFSGYDYEKTGLFIIVADGWWCSVQGWSPRLQGDHNSFSFFGAEKMHWIIGLTTMSGSNKRCDTEHVVGNERRKQKTKNGEKRGEITL